ncbi:MAG: type III pantothenate kinase [Clostridia bacterium]|nr:type III pantothenate kinase [Clostridia bacterium]
MILAIDIGNSNIVVGAIKNGEISFISRLETNHNRLEDEYATYILGILQLYGVDKNEFEGAIISSVVPPLSAVLSHATEKLIGKTPLILGPGIKTGLNIKTDNPSQLGSDIVANNVAALTKYGGPVIVIDMGTATTISVSDEKNSFVGCAIMPGITTSLNALTKKAALLQEISFEAPKCAIGTNTPDCMRSGVILGAASMVDGMVERFLAELGKDAKVIATGGHARYVVPHCKSEITYDPDLLLTGLYTIYKKNVTEG